MPTRPISDIKERSVIIFLTTSVILYVAFLTVLCFLKYRAFTYWDFDLAVHSQIMWNMLHGSLDSSILGVNFFGNHVHPVSFLFAPVYMLFPHPLTLLFLQSLALGAGAFPLYYLARLLVGYRWALVIALLYLINPLTAYINLYEFHPVAFSIFFLLCALYYYQKGNFRNYLLFLLLSMACQENIALAAIALGLHALSKHKSRSWIITPILLGTAYFLLCIFLIIPHCAKGIIEFINIYKHLGDSYTGILLKIVTQPGEILKIMFSWGKLKYLNELFALFLYLPLWSPSSLFPALPFLIQHLLSIRDSETMIMFHYTAEMIPFLLFAYVNGLKKVLSQEWVKKNKPAAAAAIFLTSFFLSAHMGPYIGLINKYNIYLQKSPLDLDKELILKEISPHEPVIATFEFLPHLTHRKSLYSFHHLYIGVHTMSKKKYYLPPDARSALIDFNDPQTFYAFFKDKPVSTFNTFINSDEWKAQRVINNLVLFQKGESEKYPLYEILKTNSEIENNNPCALSCSIELLGHGPVKINNTCLDFAVYWRSTGKTNKDIGVYYAVEDVAGEKCFFNLFSPLCYTIFPAYLWEPGCIIKEYKYLKLPNGLPEGRYKLLITFIDKITNETIKPPRADPNGMILLTEFTINE
ncbi:MAG: DUF2079 domain-containing protein [Candidatus Omnitrophota bacterium]